MTFIRTQNYRNGELARIHQEPGAKRGMGTYKGVVQDRSSVVVKTVLHSDYCDILRIYAQDGSGHTNRQKLNKETTLTVTYQYRCPGLIFYYNYKISPPGELAKGHMRLLMPEEPSICG